MPRILYSDELRERVDDMRRNAMELKLYVNIMTSTNPVKTKALEELRVLVNRVLELVDFLEGEAVTG